MKAHLLTILIVLAIVLLLVSGIYFPYIGFYVLGLMIFGMIYYLIFQTISLELEMRDKIKTIKITNEK